MPLGLQSIVASMTTDDIHRIIAPIDTLPRRSHHQNFEVTTSFARRIPGYELSNINCPEGDTTGSVDNDGVDIAENIMDRIYIEQKNTLLFGVSGCAFASGIVTAFMLRLPGLSKYDKKGGSGMDQEEDDDDLIGGQSGRGMSQGPPSAGGSSPGSNLSGDAESVDDG
ncbi:unnamed protein product [Amoebophrya sp. A25]|nr:unnamed protein product [Amoebophrya sp. A25]|eukprot:GSA25T00014666001.1